MKQISIATTTILLFCLVNLSGNSQEILSQNITFKPLLLVQAQWQLFSFSQGKFSVNLPLEPKVFKDFTDIDGQQLDWRLLRVDDDAYWNRERNEGDSPSVYVVGYTDLADEYIQQRGDALLEQMGSDLLLEFELEELNSQGKSIVLNSQPGLEFSGNLDDRIAAMRLYLVESRLYALYAISKDITNIEQFFSSFQLQ